MSEPVIDQPATNELVPVKRRPGHPSRATTDPDEFGKTLAANLLSISQRKAAKLVKVAEQQLRRDIRNPDSVRAKSDMLQTLRHITASAQAHLLTKLDEARVGELAVLQGITIDKELMIEKTMPDLPAESVEEIAHLESQVVELQRELERLRGRGELAKQVQGTPPAVPQEA
jgi:hypothetical protein